MSAMRESFAPLLPSSLQRTFPFFVATFATPLRAIAILSASLLTTSGGSVVDGGSRFEDGVAEGVNEVYRSCESLAAHRTRSGLADRRVPDG